MSQSALLKNRLYKACSVLINEYIISLQYEVIKEYVISLQYEVSVPTGCWDRWENTEQAT